MSKDGVYSPFNIEKMNGEWKSGVTVTAPDKFKTHKSEVNMDAVYSEQSLDKYPTIEGNQVELYGWSGAGDDTHLYLPNHTWHASKLYHTYDNGSVFDKFWSKVAEYTAPFEVYYYVRHGSEFPSLVEVIEGRYEGDLYKIKSDCSDFELVKMDVSFGNEMEVDY